MLFFLFVIAFVACSCVLVPVACLAIGALVGRLESRRQKRTWSGWRRRGPGAVSDS